MPQEICSLAIDAKRDDNVTEAATCWQWLNGDDGRREKRSNPKGWENVALHFDAHVEAAQRRPHKRNKLASHPV